jgi:hypothetical protein
MWPYLGPSCPDRFSSEELSAAKVEVWIRKVLDLGVIPTPGADPVPLQRGIASVRASTLGPILAVFMILSLHYSRDLVEGLGGGRGELRDADPPADAAGREASHAFSAGTRRERDRNATSWGEKRWGMDAPRSASSDKGEMERGATLPPSSPPRTTPSLPQDAAPLWTGSAIGERRRKHPERRAGCLLARLSRFFPR